MSRKFEIIELPYHVKSASIKIGLVQLDFHSLLDNTFSIDTRTPLALDYQQLLFKILNRLVEEGVDIVVFPELSIPVSYLQKIKNIVDENHILVFAGTHYVKDLNDYKNLHIKTRTRPISKLDLNKNICPILVSGMKDIYFIEKLTPGDDEAPTMKAGNRISIIDFTYGKFQEHIRIGLLICRDLLSESCREDILKANPKCLLVPSFNPNPSRFEDLRNFITKGKQCCVGISNVAEKSDKFGKSQIWALLDKVWMDKYNIKDAKVHEIDDEAILLFNFNPRGELLAVKKSELSPQIIEIPTIKIISIKEILGKDATNYYNSQKIKTSGLPEAEKIYKVYVPPKNFETIKRRLRKNRIEIISGPPYTGKTSTATYIALKYFLKGYQIIRGSDIESVLKEVKTSVRQIIYFDDPFGSIKLNDPSGIKFGDEFSQIYKIVDENHIVIITTRETVLDSAKRDTRFGLEIPKDLIRLVTKIDEEQYSWEERELMLEKHLILKRYKISQSDYEIVQNNISWIADELEFPSNINLFIEYLPANLDDDKLLEWLNEAKEETKKVFGRIFEHFGDLEKLFLYALVLCDNMKEKTVKKAIGAILYEKSKDPAIFEKLLNKLEGSSIKTHSFRRYISRGNRRHKKHEELYVTFYHPSYYSAIMETLIRYPVALENIIKNLYKFDNSNIKTRILAVISKHFDKISVSTEIILTYSYDKSYEVRSRVIDTISKASIFQKTPNVEMLLEKFACDNEIEVRNKAIKTTFKNLNRLSNSYDFIIKILRKKEIYPTTPDRLRFRWYVIGDLHSDLQDQLVESIKKHINKLTNRDKLLELMWNLNRVISKNLEWGGRKFEIENMEIMSEKIAQVYKMGVCWIVRENILNIPNVDRIIHLIINDENISIKVSIVDTLFSNLSKVNSAKEAIEKLSKDSDWKVRSNIASHVFYYYDPTTDSVNFVEKIIKRLMNDPNLDVVNILFLECKNRGEFEFKEFGNVTSKIRNLLLEMCKNTYVARNQLLNDLNLLSISGEHMNLPRDLERDILQNLVEYGDDTIRQLAQSQLLAYYPKNATEKMDD